jgi:Tat protein secretion system quality control protein TatD with DNase activity
MLSNTIKFFKYVDTHCNLPNILQKLKLDVNESSFFKLKTEQFSKYTSKVPAEFEGCISVSSDAASQDETLQLMDKIDCIHGAFGIHPLYAGNS